MKTNLFILLLFFLFVLVNQVEAQETKEENETLNTFNIYFINGYAISYDFYKHDNSAMRLHLDFNGTDLSDESSGDRYSSSSADAKITEEVNYSSLSISLSPQYMYTFLKSVYGEAYFSAGPFLGYAADNQEQITTQKRIDIVNGNLVTEYKNSYKDKIWNLGLTLVVGLKGRINDNVSLFAESHFNALKRWNSSENINSSKDIFPVSEYSYKSESKTDGDGWAFETNFVRVGVSISL